jgi:hypothetical protein
MDLVFEPTEAGPAPKPRDTHHLKPEMNRPARSHSIDRQKVDKSWWEEFRMQADACVEPTDAATTRSREGRTSGELGLPTDLGPEVLDEPHRKACFNPR